MRRAPWLTAVITSVVVVVTAASAVAQDSSDLDAVTRQLDQIESELDQARERASSAEEELEDADERLAEVEAIVNELARKLDAQQQKVQEAQAELDRLKAHAAEVQAAFDDRAIELFKHNFGSDLDAVLSAGDIQEALDRQAMIQQLNQSDRATIEQVRAAQGAVLTQQEVLDAEVERLEQVKAEQEQVLARVREIRESRALAAASARAEAAELAHQRDDLEAEQDEIERIIEERQAPPPSIAPPIISSPSSGGYIWPTCGRVTSEYGYRWGRPHRGIDIDDNRTSAIVAARSGVVIAAGWSGGYGQLTVIDHGDGVTTAYAHQSSMAVSRGQSVSQGQYIGNIGSTGNSTGPHLHFEVRVNGAAQNPRGYLPGGC